MSVGLNRRDILKAGLIGFGGMLPLGFMAKPAQAAGLFADRTVYEIAFRNAHTGESFSGAYRYGNKYLAESFARINYVLRDFRTGDIFPIDPRTIDILRTVQQRLGSKAPYEIISGYRSPRTNAMLRRASYGVARHSLHMQGQAIDSHLPDTPLGRLHDMAMSVKAGGVGYYPASNFVHMDCGPVRHWASDPNNT